jgi:hypothetical protein
MWTAKAISASNVAREAGYGSHSSAIRACGIAGEDSGGGPALWLLPPQGLLEPLAGFW